MTQGTSTDIWETASRAYVFVKVVDSSVRVEVARNIYALNEKLDISQEFVVRATVVTGPYEIIVPVYARNGDLLEEVIRAVLSQDGVDPENSAAGRIDNDLKPNDAYHPWLPQYAPGYIPIIEANPSGPGPTGKNVWG